MKIRVFQLYLDQFRLHRVYASNQFLRWNLQVKQCLLAVRKLEDRMPCVPQIAIYFDKRQTFVTRLL